MKIEKKSKWYDPEGLNIPSPAKPFFEGTASECYAKIRELMCEHNPKNGVYVEVLSHKKDADGVMRPSHIEIYYMNAIAKEYYEIVE